MNSRFSDFSVYTSIVLVLAAFFLTGWMAAPHAGNLLTSGLPALLAVLFCCVPLFFIHQRMLMGSAMVTPLFYVFLAMANPVACCFSAFHWVAMLLAVSLYAYFCFTALVPSPRFAAGTWFPFGVAALLLPSLLWLAPVLLLSSIGKAAEKGKYVITALLGLLLPALVWMALRFLHGDPLSPVDLLATSWTGMRTLHLPGASLPVVTLVRLGFTVAMTLVAYLRIVPRLSRYKTAQYHAIVRLLLLTLCLSVYTFLFLDYPALPAGLLVMLPTAPLLSVFLLDTLSRRNTVPWFVTLLLLLAAERIALFVNL